MKNIKSIKEAFTLIELTITIVIISLLIGIIFQIFIVMSHIAVKIQNERMLHSELIYVMQTIQNIIDEGDVSLYWYHYPGAPGDVHSTLNLSGSTKQYVFQLTGDILKLNEIWASTTTYILTDPLKIKINEFYIKIFPKRESAALENKFHDGFRLFLDVEIPHYNEDKWRRRVKWDMQTFFNIRKYD